VRWDGFHAKDSVSFAGLDIDDMPLLFAEEVDILGWVGLNWYFDYDGVLGLSPHSSTWTVLKETGLIEKHVIGIKHPSGPLDTKRVGHRDDGELTLGGISPEFENASFIDLPLADGDRAALWATSISSISYSNATFLLQKDLPPNAIASFPTADPFISLPGEWARLIHEQIANNWTGQIMGIPTFPCEMRDDMANLTVSLGEGDMAHNFTLSAYEYSFGILHPDEDGGEEEVEDCVLVASESARDDVIGLGWPFLRNFYTVFDDDEKLIRRR
jgi:hypothetical protein